MTIEVRVDKIGQDFPLLEGCLFYQRNGADHHLGNILQLRTKVELNEMTTRRGDLNSEGN